MCKNIENAVYGCVHRQSSSVTKELVSTSISGIKAYVLVSESAVFLLWENKKKNTQKKKGG
jgi:hypothetical protein